MEWWIGCLGGAVGGFLAAWVVVWSLVNLSFIEAVIEELRRTICRWRGVEP